MSRTPLRPPAGCSSPRMPSHGEGVVAVAGVRREERADRHHRLAQDDRVARGLRRGLRGASPRCPGRVHRLRHRPLAGAHEHPDHVARAVEQRSPRDGRHLQVDVQHPRAGSRRLARVRQPAPSRWRRRGRGALPCPGSMRVNPGADGVRLAGAQAVLPLARLGYEQGQIRCPCRRAPPSCERSFRPHSERPHPLPRPTLTARSGSAHHRRAQSRWPSAPRCARSRPRPCGPVLEELLRARRSDAPRRCRAAAVQTGPGAPAEAAGRAAEPSRGPRRRRGRSRWRRGTSVFTTLSIAPGGCKARARRRVGAAFWTRMW